MKDWSTVLDVVTKNNKQLENISNIVQEWSTNCMKEMTTYENNWLRENLFRQYRYYPTDMQFVKSDGWTLECQDRNLKFTKYLKYKNEYKSMLIMEVSGLTNHYFTYIIENDDGFRTEGIV